MLYCRFLPVIAALLLANASFGDDREPPFRLRSNVIPEAYRLDLTIVPDRPRFSGRAEIDVIITEPIDEIWLHGRDLQVDRATVITRTGETWSATYEQFTTDGMARLVPENSLSPQRVTLRFEYSAAFGAELNGLYKVTVGENDYAFSQLESIAARKVFPSFDEPGFKTRFEITVTTRDRYRAFSNTTAIKTVMLPEEMQRISYAPTEPLPTYLVAFAVGPLDVVEWRPVAPTAYRSAPVPLRGIAASGQGPRLAYALENTEAILHALEEYFGIAYPFDKLDIVAVPDFAAGAMENAGLITYREPLLLFEDHPAVDQVRRYAIVHTHELAHQWFGNLVTMPWWDDIWLNEAFASWIQARIANEWDPRFHFDRETQVRAIHAMREDSLVSARQIREPVTSTADIKNAFDAITYQKGAGVLQMLESYLGATAFQTGLREHVERHAFGTANVYDLMDSLQQVAGDEISVEAVFESFLFQPGVPYITIEKRCADSRDKSAQIRMSQQRYLPMGSSGDPDRRWRIPVCLAYGNADAVPDERHTQCVLLSDETQSFRLKNGACPDWIMPNADGAGYFRWRLHADDFESLAAVFPAALNTGERLSFVDSLIAGVANGSVEMRTFLETLPMIAADPDRHIVTEPFATYRRLFSEVIAPELREAAAAFASALYFPRIESLGSAGSGTGAAESGPEAAILRYQLSRFLAVDLGVTEVRRRLSDSAYRYLGYQTDAPPEPAALDPDLLRPALIIAAQDGDSGFIAFLIDRFRSSRDARFRQAAMEALAFVSDSGGVERVRKFALGDDVRLNELDTWLRWLLNPTVRERNLEWVQQNLGEILSIGGERIGREAPYTFGRWLCSPEDAKVLAAMFEGTIDQYPGTERNLARAIESIELCIAFREQHSASSNAFFANYRVQASIE